MHGLGNDFVLADYYYFENYNDSELSSAAIKICDRRYGIGADGLILYRKGEDGAPVMKLWNADGSKAEMCGNGIRCLAKLLVKENYQTSNHFNVKTDAGIKEVFVDDKTGDVGVDMGTPEFSASKIPAISESEFFIEQEFEAGGKTWKGIAVGMGNPHVVIFTNEPEHCLKYGSAIEKHNIFPKGTNVEFALASSPHNLKVYVWERGVGATPACGTGACAAYAAACKIGKCVLYADVLLPGGVLKISSGNKGNIQMRGPADIVFKGQYYL